MAAKFSTLDRAKAQLVLSHPFFASILLRGKLVERNDIPTAAVDARGTIYYNKAFFEKLDIQEVVFVLAHECFHKMLQHFARLGGRNPQKANYAQDACINDILKSSDVGKQPEGCVNMPGSKDKTWEEVYAELPESPPGGGKDYMDGDGIGNDVIPGGEMTQAEMSEIASAMKVEIAQAAQAARMQGKMPAALQRFVDGILYVKTPWHTILERFMTSLTKSDYSWAKPNKRYAGQGIYLPSMASEPTMGEIVLVVDTSGSIGERELAECQAHLNRILETCHPEKLHLVYCDAVVNKTCEVFPEDMPFTLEAVGGGGTDMMVALDWVGEHVSDPAVIVVLTDGHTPFEGPRPECEVIWLITSDVVAPFGETIKFEG